MLKAFWAVRFRFSDMKKESPSKTLKQSRGIAF